MVSIIMSFHFAKAGYYRITFFGLVAIFVINWIGLFYGWYGLITWFDEILHFGGGFFMALFLVGYFGDGPRRALRPYHYFLLIISVTVLIGVVWEFFEFILDTVGDRYLVRKFGVRSLIGDLSDTLNDLAMDSLGAVLIVLLLQGFKKLPRA